MKAKLQNLALIIIIILVVLGIYHTAFHVVIPSHQVKQISLGCKQIDEKTTIKNIILLCVEEGR